MTWRATASLTRVLVWVLGVTAAAQLMSIPFDSGEALVKMRPAFQAAFDGRVEEANRLSSQLNDSGSSMVSFTNFLTVVMLVLLVTWTWRTAKNARALGRDGERIAPLLGVFSWFIPVASFVMPYLAVSDLWRSSDPLATRGSEWRRLPGAVVVRAWWVCFVGAQLVSASAVALAVVGNNGVDATTTLLTIGHTVSAIAAVLTIAVVTEITRRQAAQHALEPVSVTPSHPTSVPSPEIPGDAGWYFDPSGRHEQRYWDGSAWTERVQSAGVQSFAPVTAPDWYEDPTGRFPFRYWTGYSWTEHVSRDGELFVDEL
ncbi:MAG: DUF4328 domain-containing protein [Acidimicrobiia bacterium]